MASIVISQAVGLNAPNRPEDVKAIAQRLVEIGKLPSTGGSGGSGVMDAALLQGIAAAQRHFMAAPDQLINANGSTLGYLNNWSVKPISPGVQLPGRLREAWDWVNPLLPPGSSCTSGFRSADEQRQILHKFYTTTYRAEILATYGQPEYNRVATDLLGNEARVVEMVCGIGQLIAAPGKSAHQQGKAIDIGGPDDAGQVKVVELVARAHVDLLSGKVLKERNGCVHFELR
jgi:hypothetical protein